MNKQLFILMMLGFSVAIANPKVKDLQPVMQKGMIEEKTSILKLMKQISMMPVSEKGSPGTHYKVMKVEKGSVFDRQGIKPGDVVDIGTPPAE